MEFKDILAISGQPGLYKFVAQSKNGVIVESLADGKRSNVPSAAKVSALSEIAVYTANDEKPLSVLYDGMFAATGDRETISGKSAPEELKKKFAEFLPDFDEERVHVSDIKKIFNWYNTLVAAGMKKFQPAEEAENDAGEESADKTDKKASAGAAKAAKPAAKSKTTANKNAGTKASTASKASTPKGPTKK